MKTRTRNLTISLLISIMALVGANAFATSIPFYSFGPNDGEYLSSGVIQASDGNFYGSTPPNYFGPGTLFRITPDGKFTTLHIFIDDHGNYGPSLFSPSGSGLVQAQDGYLYGTTMLGGAFGFGSVFRIGTDGTFSTIYSFTGYADSATPGDLIQGTDGNLYGTTLGSGYLPDAGTVFKITPSGQLTTLHRFDFSVDGIGGNALVQGKDGNFYGTTWQGGRLVGGTIFKMTASGEVTVLHAFELGDPPLHNQPIGALVSAADGNLYGTTSDTYAYPGSFFRISPSGDFATLHEFRDDGYEGIYPSGGLIQASDGNFYGTADTGGNVGPPGTTTFGAGTVFKITPTGDLTLLHSFNGIDGAGPSCKLIEATTGDLYGTTRLGGYAFPATYGGTVFAITPPLTFGGFSSPIGDSGAPADSLTAGAQVATSSGGSYSKPLRAFKFGSTIPIKFQLTFGPKPITTGIQTLRAIKYSSAVDSDPPIDATPTDAATSGNQFRVTDAAHGGWQFNLSTASMSVGTWKLVANLSDGSSHEVWITIK